MRKMVMGLLFLVATGSATFGETTRMIELRLKENIFQSQTAEKKPIPEGAAQYRRVVGGVCFGFVGWTVGINLGHKFLPEAELLSATSLALASTILGYSLPGENKKVKIVTGWLAATAVSNTAMWLTRDGSGLCFLISLPLSKCLWDLSFGRGDNE